MVNESRLLGCMLFALCGGCGVHATGDDTGGVSEVGAGGCPSGLTVLMSDYVSTQVALSALDGATRSSSLVSTASTKTLGLAFALSGDVVLPGSPPDSGSVVLIDRFGTNVLSWVDPKSGEVLAQLPVGTGFESNPQDYVEVDEKRAFVSRWGQNDAAGREPFDRGGDLLVIDLEKTEVVNSIEMPTVDDLPPRPAGLVRVGSEVIVALDRVALDFDRTGAAMLIGVSSADEAIDWELTLEGLKGCGRPVPSPDGRRMALACSGALDPEGQVESLDQSALVLLDARQNPPVELRRIPAEQIAGEPLQADVEFASDDVVLLKTQTALGAAAGNRWLALDLDAEDAEVLLEAEPDETGGQGLVFGSMACAPGCSPVCVLTDSKRGVLERVRVEGSEFELLEPVRVEERVGLPPRALVKRN